MALADTALPAALESTTADGLLCTAAQRWPEAPALWRDDVATSYADLDARVERVATRLRATCPLRGSRVAVWLDKRVDTVVALFAAMRAGHVAVPVNPALRAPQVLACLTDCRAALLISDGGRLAALAGALTQPAIGEASGAGASGSDFGTAAGAPTCLIDIDSAEGRALMREAATDAASGPGDCGDTRTAAAQMARNADELAILFYTSGSTGAPKGVMVTHANLLAGAEAVNAYLCHTPDDRLLAALPLSFDAGFSQLTTAFAAGASVVLLDHLFPADVLAAIDRHSITGITAVPPLYLQLLRALPAAAARFSAAGADPTAVPAHREQGRGASDNPHDPGRRGASLRYFANTGGHLPRTAWQALRAAWPRAEPHSMYGLTEAFRASRLPPADFDRKPDSIGLAVPGGTRLHVLRADGTPCAPHQPGELVQQGPLVARGYWNDPARSALRFRPGPDGEPAVWSGDTVRRDAEGYLYFIGRDDEQIKTSGYRVSPTEVEAAAAAAGWPECAAVGVPDALLGQVIVLVVACRSGAGDAVGPTGPKSGSGAAHSDTTSAPDTADLLAALRAALPAWMVPRRIDAWPGVLPRNANGKFDRVLIRQMTLQHAGQQPALAEGDGND